MKQFSQFDPGSRRALLKAGILTESAALEVLSRPGALALPDGERCRMLASLEATVGEATAGLVRRHRLPTLSLGVAGRPRTSRAVSVGPGDQVNRSLGVDKAIRQLKAIKPSVPEEFSLLDYVSKVGQQGGRGTCVGWAVAKCLDFFHRLPRHKSGLRNTRGPGTTQMSPLCAYLMAKRRDGHPGEGTWQEYAWQEVMEYGCLPESVVPYDMTTNQIDPAQYARVAARYRIAGYMDLLLPEELAVWQPDLIRSFVSGLQDLGLGPQPVCVSIGVTESFGYLMAQETGRIAVLKNAPILGGHAMLCVGYYWDPAIEQYVFILLNSWGLEWAAKSPVHAGCALVPEEYFRCPELTWELFTPLTRPSPATALGWLGSFMRRGWDSRTLALT